MTIGRECEFYFCNSFFEKFLYTCICYKSDGANSMHGILFSTAMSFEKNVTKTCPCNILQYFMAVNKMIFR